MKSKTRSIYSQTIIARELTEVAEAMLARGEPKIETDALALAVFNSHVEGAALWWQSGPDADYFLCATWIFTRDLGLQIANRFKVHDDPKVDRQYVLPGYEYLQQYYAVEEGGKSILVRIEHMSVQQIRAKQAEHQAHGEGHLAHANELARYADLRESQLASGAA